MRMYEKKPTKKKDLWEILQEIWYDIEVFIVRKLIFFVFEKTTGVYQTKCG